MLTFHLHLSILTSDAVWYRERVIQIHGNRHPFLPRGFHPLIGRRIALDPGHGGEERGAPGASGTLEKDVNLAIGMKLRDTLMARGAEVFMTRDRDETVRLEDRPKILDTSRFDLFLSNHANASGLAGDADAPPCTGEPGTASQEEQEASRKETGSSQESPEVGALGAGHGTETYSYRGGSRQERRLANLIQKELVHALNRRDRGVKRANFLVLREAHARGVPSALVEVMFMDDPEEEKLLNDPKVQEMAADAIADGIEEFFAEEWLLHDAPCCQTDSASWNRQSQPARA